MEEAGEMKMFTTAAGLQENLAMWNNPPATKRPIAFLLTLECADAFLAPQYVQRAYEQGLRAVGPAHYGPGTYAQGTDASGGIGARGRELLKEMDGLGMILDATHLCDESFWESLENFSGPVWASHHNCRAVVPHNRQLTDEQLRALFDRGAVIGAALDAWMLVPGWVRGKTTPESSGVSMSHVVDHMDHICQLAGNTDHVGIGSDLDGAFGREQSPKDLNTIADLQMLASLLQKRGYGEADVEKIFHGNFVRFLNEAL
jgi:membrane dipeptidase